MAKKKPSEGLRSLHVEIEHFKNIPQVIVDINGKSFLIVGKNKSGKSSFIQAMLSPMDRKLLPADPVTKGEERARIQHRIGGTINGEYKEYTLELYFSQKNRKGTLKVFNDKGEETKSPSTFIESLIGNVSFDVMAWMNAKKDKKLEMLKELTGKAREIDLINMDIKKVKEDRKYKKDRAEQLEAVTSSQNHEFDTEEKREMYMTPVDLTAVQNEQAKIINDQRIYDDFQNRYNVMVTDHNRTVEDIKKSFIEQENTRQEIDRLQNKLIEQNNSHLDLEIKRTEMADKLTKGQTYLNNTQRPDITNVNAKMQAAIEHNERHSRIGMLGNQQQEKLSLIQEVDKLTIDVDVLEQRRNAVIANSQLPVDGLSFSDEDIFLHGLPLEHEQINTATLIEVGVDIAMALNPTLKCIFLHDGSLLDEQMLKKVIKKIEDADYQAIVEIVGEQETPEIVFTETEIEPASA